jgi:hypothetical protein
MIPQANSIDEVISILKEIISQTKKEPSTLGYFAVLYCKVTEKVKKGIQKGDFQNGTRMEKLDVIFANRYIKAYYTYKKSEQPSLCWEVAFKESTHYWLIVLQHLLLGMNAHINLDLGIAAAQVCPGNEITNLKADFDKINEILASLVGNVEKALSDVWPTLKWIIQKTQKLDTFLINFSMQTARDGAWKFALQLAPLDAKAIEKTIKKRDAEIAQMAKLVTNPGYIASSIFKIIRISEKGTILTKIEVLEKTI